MVIHISEVIKSVMQENLDKIPYEWATSAKIGLDNGILHLYETEGVIESRPANRMTSFGRVKVIEYRRKQEISA